MAELTPLANIHMEGVYRTIRAQETLGIGYRVRPISYAFAAEPGPWSLLSLSEYTGISRSTITRMLYAAERRGSVVKKADGYEIAPYNLFITRKMINETTEIVVGRRTGYSEDVIEACDAVYRKCNPEAARKISFPAMTGMVALEEGVHLGT